LFVLDVKTKKCNGGCLPLPFPALENSKALPAPPAEAVQPPVAPPVAPNNGILEYWMIGIMGSKIRRPRVVSFP